MSQQGAELPVEPGLFPPLEEYASAFSRGEVNPYDDIDAVVVTFCQQFFKQFLQSVVGLDIEEPGEESKEAVERRVGLEPDALTAPGHRLVLTFQDLCDMWPDIKQQTYSGSQAVFRWVHETYLPRLLWRIEDWAATQQYEQVAALAGAARRLFGAVADEPGAEAPRAAVEKDPKDVIRLVELDYTRTADFISGLMQRQAGLRGLAATIWVAILGFAFDHSAWELGVLAVAAVLVFAILDGYYSLLYTEARAHAGDLERISASYYGTLVRDDGEGSDRALQSALKRYRFGLYGSLRPFKIKDLARVQQRMMFRFFYPLLAAGATLATIVIAVGVSK